MALPEKIQQQRNEMVKQIVEDIKSGKPFFWDSGHYGKYPRNLLKALKGTDQFYHGINNLKLTLAAKQFGFSDSRWATFKQAQEIGAKIKKGAKGIPIEFWQYTRPLLEINPETGKKEQVYEINPKTGEKEAVYVNLRQPLVKSYVVFNAEQMEGVKPEIMPKASLEETNEAMENMIKNSEAPIFYDQKHENYYSITRDEIHVMPREKFKTMDAFYATTAHEIAHSTGSEKRLNRETVKNNDGYGGKNYAKEELRAELTSMFLQQKYNIKFDEKHYENHAAYLQSWAEELENEPNEIFKAATEAEKAMKYIEERIILKEKYIQHKKTAVIDTAADTTESANEINTVQNVDMNRINTIQNYSIKHQPQTVAQKYLLSAQFILNKNKNSWNNDCDKKIIDDLVQNGENNRSIQNAVSKFSPIKYKNTEINNMIRIVSQNRALTR